MCFDMKGELIPATSWSFLAQSIRSRWTGCPQSPREEITALATEGLACGLGEQCVCVGGVLGWDDSSVCSMSLLLGSPSGEISSSTSFLPILRNKNMPLKCIPEDSSVDRQQNE